MQWYANLMKCLLGLFQVAFRKIVYVIKSHNKHNEYTNKYVRRYMICYCYSAKTNGMLNWSWSLALYTTTHSLQAKQEIYHHETKTTKQQTDATISCDYYHKGSLIHFNDSILKMLQVYKSNIINNICRCWCWLLVLVQSYLRSNQQHLTMDFSDWAKSEKSSFQPVTYSFGLKFKREREIFKKKNIIIFLNKFIKVRLIVSI